MANEYRANIPETVRVTVKSTEVSKTYVTEKRGDMGKPATKCEAIKVAARDKIIQEIRVNTQRKINELGVQNNELTEERKRLTAEIEERLRRMKEDYMQQAKKVRDEYEAKIFGISDQIIENEHVIKFLSTGSEGFEEAINCKFFADSPDTEPVFANMMRLHPQHVVD